VYLEIEGIAGGVIFFHGTAQDVKAFSRVMNQGRTQITPQHRCLYCAYTGKQAQHQRPPNAAADDFNYGKTPLLFG
jgi:hypothetical protein